MKTNMKLLMNRLAPALICLAILTASVLGVRITDDLEQKRALRLDFSFNSVTTQSEQTSQVLRSLPYPVHAYALFTPGMEDQSLIGLLNRLAALSPQFTYSLENLVQNPMLVNTLSSSLQDDQVNADSLILICETTGRTRVLNPYNYLEQSFDTDAQAYVLSGLSYEKSLVEALLYITLDSVPAVRILNGHGELSADETAYMENFLASHHFEISRINLLSGDQLQKEDLLMILSPQKDLLESELKLLTEFSQSGGSIMVTSDYSDPDALPLFDSLYRQMGFERKPGIVIAEGADLEAYIDNPLFLTPYMDMTEPTAPLIGAGQTRLRLPGSRALGVAALSETIQVEPLLTSGQAYIKSVEQANQTLAKDSGDEEGQFYLALLSDYAHPSGTHARGMMIGNSAILIDSWLHEVTNGAQFLLHMVNYLSAEEPINLEIAPKTLVREQLNIPQPWVPILIIVLLPLMVAATAIPVLLKRRRR